MVQVDATFKTAHVDFYQLPIFHCFVLNTITLVLQILMSCCKLCFLYVAEFFDINLLAPQLAPETSVSDFEIAVYSSIEFIFGSHLEGCLLHYRRKLCRKMQQHGFSWVKVKGVVSQKRLFF